jgi:hypothetical protein
LKAILGGEQVSADKANDLSIINVIDQFNYSTQTDAYNENFKKWRRNKENPYTFSFEANKNEKVFVDTKGFVDRSAKDVEKDVLSRIFSAIGIAALIWMSAEDIFGRIGIYLCNLMGIDIHNNFFSSAIYGGSKEIVIALIVITLIKIAVPGLYLHFVFKLPGRVEFMYKLHNSTALLGAIAMALIVCTAASLPSAYSSESKEIYDYFRSTGTDVSVWDQWEFLVYTIFDIVIVSILTEMFFRGAMFAVLRQFGDPFAILITSFTAGFLTMDPQEMPVVILISIVASYGMISSGTILTPIAVSIVYKMYNLTILMIETDPTDRMPLTRNIFMIISLSAGIIGFSAYWMRCVRKKKNGIANYSSELPTNARIFHSVKTFPYSAAALICIAVAAVRAAL